MEYNKTHGYRFSNRCYYQFDVSFINFNILHLICLLSFPSTGVSFILIKYYSFPNWLRVSILTTYALLFSMQIYIEDIYLVATLAKLVYPDIQSFADSIRLGSSRLGALFALLFSASLFDYIFPLVIFFTFVTNTVFMFYLYRRKLLANPVVIINIRRTERRFDPFKSNVCSIQKPVN